MRPNSEYIDNIIGHTFPILDHGFIRVVDYMGTDTSIVQAARVSYGDGTKTTSDDQALIRYLMKHRHTTPFEMCLDGSTRIQTFTCIGATVKHYTIKQISEAFEKGGKDSSWVKLLYIRTVDPDTGMVLRTKIKKAWKTGIKQTYRVTVGKFSRQIIVTGNHPFLCADGKYRPVDDLSVGDKVMLNGTPATPEAIKNQVIKLRKEGKRLEEISEITSLAVSTISNFVRDVGLGKGFVSRRTGFIRVARDSLSDPRYIARSLVPEGPCSVCHENGTDVHHIDENPWNNDLDNLIRLCSKHHRHMHTYGLLKQMIEGEITAIELVGDREVFDLEVESDYHNFVAEGFVVHNCEIKFHLKMPIFVARQWIRHRTFTINEYSARYSVVPEEYYVPEVVDICVQSSVNKQGRAEPLGHEDAQAFRNKVNKSAKESYFEYEAAIADGVARELARIGLPLNFYTEFYWKGDLHNLFHFLSLRCDHHAQYEIRVYANQILEIVRGWVPFAAKAFEDYRMNAVTLSAAEVSVLKAMLKDEELDFSGMSKRESSEFREKWW
jgi:flavin-dependent thymidylate synthase